MKLTDLTRQPEIWSNANQSQEGSRHTMQENQENGGLKGQKRTHETKISLGSSTAAASHGHLLLQPQALIWPAIWRTSEMRKLRGKRNAKKIAVNAQLNPC